MNDLKVDGKVADFCPKCKNCKSTTRECDGKKDWLTEVECEDPYDGMIKTLAADSDICCSMFIPKPDRACAKCERFDGTITISYKALFGEPVDCPSFEEKKDKEFNTLVSDLYKQIQELKSDNARLDRLYSERDRELKGLIKASKRKDELIQGYREKLKKVESHDKALTNHFQNDEALIDNIQKVIFPQEEGSDYTYSYEEILNKVKDLKVQSDENGTMYEEIKELRAKNREYFNEISDRLAKHTDQCDEIAKLKKEKEELIHRYNMIAKKLNDIHDILKEESDNE